MELLSFEVVTFLSFASMKRKEPTPTSKQESLLQFEKLKERIEGEGGALQVEEKEEDAKLKGPFVYRTELRC
jgi:hypothetical protein